MNFVPASCQNHQDLHQDASCGTPERRILRLAGSDVTALVVLISAFFSRCPSSQINSSMLGMADRPRQAAIPRPTDSNGVFCLMKIIIGDWLGPCWMATCAIDVLAQLIVTDDQNVMIVSHL
jgi:hypothetical protein